MLGKSLWKMHNCDESVLSIHRPEGYQPAIEAFMTAIKHIPNHRDNRHPEKDPILEPQYKLVSTVHKLVSSGRIEVSNSDPCNRPLTDSMRRSRQAV